MSGEEERFSARSFASILGKPHSVDRAANNLRIDPTCASRDANDSCRKSNTCGGVVGIFGIGEVVARGEFAGDDDCRE